MNMLSNPMWLFGFYVSITLECAADNKIRRNNKKDKISGLQILHSTFPKSCTWFDKDETFGSKWGRFKPYQRINVCKSPLPFVIDDKRIFEYVEPGAKH